MISPKPAAGMLGSGTKAPAFELTGVDGERWSSEVLFTAPTMLFLFKAGCPVCQMSAPFLERMSKGGRVRLIGISQDDCEVTRRFCQRFGLSFPVLLDPASRNYPASNGFGIQSVPAFFLIEHDGIISKSFNGFSKPDLEDLGERLGAPPFTGADRVPIFRPG